VAARLGGDEFAALLVGGDGQEVPAAAERVRDAVARAMRARGWAVTASVGAVTFRTPPESEQAALDAADAVMYAAKAAGRNRVAHAGAAEAPPAGRHDAPREAAA
jgi:diguanylate cyclase (GGDEF)-like protein